MSAHTITVGEHGPELTTLPLPGDGLTVADRSDASSSAQAVVRVRHITYGVLDFDKHHYDKHETALISQGWTVEEDLRHTLK